MTDPRRMKMIIPQSKVKNLMSRAGFGLNIRGTSSDEQQLFKESRTILPLQAIPKPEIDFEDMKSVKSDSSRRQMMKDLLGKSQLNLMKLNASWMDKIIQEPSLRERMTFFWHGHFACRTLVPYFAQQQNNTLRTFALDNFRELLMAASKDPAMLQFLNNQQNRKDHPNENFAREVMELFTLGRGNYDEQDVKEAARAFTGWGFNFQGEYQFRQKQHDFNDKTFRGNTRNYTGEEIIQAILDDKKTARFITRKLYRYFVSEGAVKDQVINDWADLFYHSGYNIERLLKAIFQSSDFNNPAYIGTRIKSPIDLLVGFQLHTGGKFENPQSLVFLQRAMGQILFYPPNVSGWPAGKGWIDSSSLAFRLNLPALLFAGTETDFQANDDGDANGLGKVSEGKKKLHCTADWSAVAARFTRTTAEATQAQTEEFLLARPTSPLNRKLIADMAVGSPNDQEFIKRIFIGYMSLPDYQMC